MLPERLVSAQYPLFCALIISAAAQLGLRGSPGPRRPGLGHQRAVHRPRRASQARFPVRLTTKPPGPSDPPHSGHQQSQARGEQGVPAASPASSMALASMSHDRQAVTAGNKHQCLVRQAGCSAARSRLLSCPSLASISATTKSPATCRLKPCWRSFLPGDTFVNCTLGSRIHPGDSAFACLHKTTATAASHPS